MRLLHPGHAHDLHRHVAKICARNRRRNSPCALRQPVPVHRLWAHRRSSARRARSTPGRPKMIMHALSGGRLRMRKSIYLPEAPGNEFVELPVSSFLIRHSQGNVLFDTGCHPDVAENAKERWGSLVKLMTPISGPKENVLLGLQELGFGPHDIDVVISSHLHPDHCGCNSFFQKATVICHACELEAAQQLQAEKAGYL